MDTGFRPLDFEFIVPDIPFGQKYRWIRGPHNGKVVTFKEADQTPNGFILKFSIGTCPASQMFDYLQPVSPDIMGTHEGTPDMLNVNSHYEIPQPEYRNLAEGTEYEDEVNDLLGGKRTNASNQKNQSFNPVISLLQKNEDFDEVPLTIRVDCQLPNTGLVKILLRSYKGCDSELVEYIISNCLDDLIGKMREALICTIKDHYQIEWSEPEPVASVVQEETKDSDAPFVDIEEVEEIL